MAVATSGSTDINCRYVYVSRDFCFFYYIRGLQNVPYDYKNGCGLLGRFTCSVGSPFVGDHTSRVGYIPKSP